MMRQILRTAVTLIWAGLAIPVLAQHGARAGAVTHSGGNFGAPHISAAPRTNFGGGGGFARAPQMGFRSGFSSSRNFSGTPRFSAAPRMGSSFNNWNHIARPVGPAPGTLRMPPRYSPSPGQSRIVSRPVSGVASGPRSEPKNVFGFREPYNPDHRGGDDRGGDRRGDHSRHDGRDWDHDRWHHDRNRPTFYASSTYLVGGWPYGYPYYPYNPILNDWDDWNDWNDDFNQPTATNSYAAPYSDAYAPQGSYNEPQQTYAPVATAAASREEYQSEDDSPRQTNVAESKPLDRPTVTLIFKDGRTPLEVHNYALTRSTVYVLDEKRRDIPVEQLDLAATQQTNHAAGVDFNLPGGN